MSVNVFEGDDSKYLAWLKENNKGYVLNIEQSRNPALVSFHRTSCPSINDTGRYPTGGFTERRYIKVCGDSPEELHKWVKKNIRKDGKFTRRCSKCDPIDSEPLTENGYDPTEVADPGQYFEGAIKKVYVNKYERDGAARKACIAYYGVDCSVCGLNFGNNYGDLGERFIHVHHLVPLSEIKKGYSPDPIKDLRPVCPNCHAMLHSAIPPLSIENLKVVIKAAKK